jgi:hypothetical protein
MNGKYQESPDLISAFEASYIEVEFVAAKPLSGGHHPVIVASFSFRTRPDMSARKEYQTGPMHLGRMDLNLRAYGWTPEQLKAYRDMKRREDIELLGILDSQLGDVMNTLGAEFEKYLIEAGEEIAKPEPAPTEKKKIKLEDTALGPVVSIFSGFKELGEALVPVDLFKGGSSSKGSSGGGSPYGARGTAVTMMFLVYNTYKKSRRMTTW